MRVSIIKPLWMVCALWAAAPGWAYDSAPTQPKTAAERVADDTEAEVRRIDRANGKVTLKHGYIKSIDMPPMTMVFSVKDPTQLEGLKVGDNVRFQLDPEPGQLRITHITRLQ